MKIGGTGQYSRHHYQVIIQLAHENNRHGCQQQLWINTDRQSHQQRGDQPQQWANIWNEIKYACQYAQHNRHRQADNSKTNTGNNSHDKRLQHNASHIPFQLGTDLVVNRQGFFKQVVGSKGNYPIAQAAKVAQKEEGYQWNQKQPKDYVG